MPRLPITPSVIKRLYAHSANQCAFPGCTEKLYEEASNLSNICHIEGAEAGGERFNTNNTDEQNRSYKNLILLCTKHHKITDDVDEYPTERLKQMKADHEQRVSEFMTAFSSKAKYLLQSVAFNPDELVGRTKEIEALRQAMFNGTSTILVNGLGGIGKTTLAKAYVHKYRSHYRHILWVSKQSQHIYDDILNHPTITVNLNYTQEQQISNPKLERAHRMAHLQQALLQLEGPNLLVLDNVEEELGKQSNIDLLPNHANQWHIIGTSRISKHLVNTLNLSVLPEADAVKLFIKHNPNAETDEALPTLLEEIGYHTLSITLLAKTMNSPICNLNCAELTELIKNHQWGSSELQATIIDAYSEEEQNVFTHLDAAFSLANLDELEIWWLKHFVIMPAQGYTLNFLMEITGFNKAESDDRNELVTTLQKLVDKGWILFKGTDGDKLFECHRLIQEVLLHKPKINIEDGDKLLLYIRNLGDRVYVDIEKGEHAIDKKEWVIYCERMYHILTNYYHKFYGILLADYANLLKYIFGNYKVAAKIYEEILVTLNLDKENNNGDITVIQSNLANVYRELGRYEEAAQLLETALENDMINFDETHPKINIHLSNLANAYSDLGRYNEAVKLLEITLKNGIEYHDITHPTVMNRQLNLANAHRMLERYDVALELLRTALKNAIIHYGEIHPKVSLYQANLAGIYSDLKRYEEAIELLEIALKSDIKHFGIIHPTVATRFNNLAFSFIGLQLWNKAISCTSIALSIDIKKLGIKHLGTQTVFNTFAYQKKVHPTAKVDIDYLVNLTGLEPSVFQNLLNDLEVELQKLRKD